MIGRYNIRFSPNSSQLSGVGSNRSSSMFADTGIPAFLDALLEMGVNAVRMKVVIAGGAKVMDQSAAFNIDHQNHRAAHHRLSQHQVTIHYEDIGGTFTRTLILNVGSGLSSIHSVGQGEKII